MIEASIVLCFVVVFCGGVIIGHIWGHKQMLDAELEYMQKQNDALEADVLKQLGYAAKNLDDVRRWLQRNSIDVRFSPRS